MNLGLKITNWLYINKQYISQLSLDNIDGDIGERYFTICLSHPNDFFTIRENANPDAWFPYDGHTHYLPINEFHRISREIKEYLGIDEAKKTM